MRIPTSSFHLLTVGGAGGEHAVMDPTVMEYRPAPGDMQSAEWAAPFYEHAEPERWTLFEAVLVLGGSGASEMLPISQEEKL